MARMVETWTVDVDRPPEEVFAYLCDAGRHAEWSPRDYRVEGAPDRPLQPGDTFVSYGWVPRDDDHRNEVRVDELVSPTRLRLVSTDGEAEYVNTFEVSATAGGSRVARTMDFPKPKGAVALAFPMLMRTVIRPGVQEGMDLLKTRLEHSE